MKLNLKSTIAAPTGHKSLNGIIGNTRRGIVVDKTLDPDSNNPVANKPVSTALAALAGQLEKGQVVFLDQLPESGEPHKVYVLTATNQRYWWDGSAFVKIVPTDIKDSATIKHTLTENKISLDLDETIKGKIDAALQKPTGLTKTELVGVGTNGQENIEIGDNLTLKDGKLNATFASGGNSIPVVEGTIDTSSSETEVIINIPQAQTEPFILHIEDMQSYILMSVIMGAYLGYLYEGRNEKVAYIFQGADTTINVTITNPIVPIVNATNTDDSDRYTIPESQTLAFILHIIDSSGEHNIFMSATNDGTLYYYYGIEDINNSTITYYYGSGSTIQRHILNLSKEGSLFGKYDILVPRSSTSTGILPCFPSDNGKVLSVVNGEAQWAASGIKTLDIEFKFNGTITLTQEQLSLINSYDRKYVYVKFNEGIVGDNVCLGYVIKRQDIGTAISIVSQPNISGNIIVQSAIRIIGTTAGHEEITVPFSTTNSEKFLKTNSEGKPEWASISTPTITFED